MTAIDTAPALDTVMVVVLGMRFDSHRAIGGTDGAAAASVLIQFETQEANPVEKRE